MKFCQPHWEKLRAAIDERGLSHLVARGGEQAVRNLASEQREGPSIQTFDPLMAAHNAIVGNALGLVGIEVMYGDRCPICYLNEIHEATCKGAAEGCRLPLRGAYDDWIRIAADESKQAADRLLADAEPDA